MSEFSNVTVVREANVYFGGKVVSRNVLFADGTRKTLGYMMPGEYTFDTGAAEIMEVLGGEMTVLLPGQSEWQTFTVGQSYDVPANSSFSLKISGDGADYCCSYAKA
ncbi:pyrimidine/purine nucleoside phosphorylase [Ruficoccus sp. ZRK36]|uniref:pyrimidine/purine nucleoside phosphorylase n=1 Tax=Ruficoccus sp. ZRK36 TaxID=2866311 RepID=UPI001C733027|nr:pyrimidine/purine nucleoside phosphorylase [Ruficoccus sp. ZRK36]QYY36543.1 pyrimidine/purine nucleoside phosphorylase [Ruficoccus sp. ZRK36]